MSGRVARRRRQQARRLPLAMLVAGSPASGLTAADATAGPVMKYVLLYESADDVLTTAPLHFEAHVAWAQQFAERGELLQLGAFEDPQAHGSMAVFTSREAAEAFTAGDPFVHNGVVRRYEIRGWDEALDPR